MKIDSYINRTIRAATGTVSTDLLAGTPPSILQVLRQTNEIVPPWWSVSRDQALRQFWKSVSHLSMAVYNAQSLLTTIPIKIEALDSTNTRHVDMAEEYTYLLLMASEFGDTFINAKRKMVEDYLATDNGGFMEVIGDGEPDGPIIGPPLAVRHLDSLLCQRTSNKTYPVLYTDPATGIMHKLHRSRVIYMSQMTSASAYKNGVGFCAVSRALQVAQNLYDIYIYKQEKLGSRPPNKILIGRGIQAQHIAQAMQMAQESMSNMGLTRYSRTVAIGSDNTDIDLKDIDLSSFDPFNEESSITLGMYAIASAFGLPIEELWPASARSGRDAGNQESRQRGKMTIEFNTEFEAHAGQKLLPPFLRFVHDWRDDQQDRQIAVNRDIRARNRQRDYEYGGIDVRTARQDMLAFQDITRDQFITMERESGRLEDGKPVSSLFYTSRPLTQAILNDPSVPFPTDILNNDKMAMLKWISERLAMVDMALGMSERQSEKRELLDIRAALDWLEEQYVQSNNPAQELLPVPTQEDESTTQEEMELGASGQSEAETESQGVSPIGDPSDTRVDSRV